MTKDQLYLNWCTAVKNAIEINIVKERSSWTLLSDEKQVIKFYFYKNKTFKLYRHIATSKRNKCYLWVAIL